MSSTVVNPSRTAGTSSTEMSLHRRPMITANSASAVTRWDCLGRTMVSPCPMMVMEGRWKEQRRMETDLNDAGEGGLSRQAPYNMGGGRGQLRQEGTTGKRKATLTVRGMGSGRLAPSLQVRDVPAEPLEEEALIREEGFQ